jgi:hypothetical protein
MSERRKEPRFAAKGEVRLRAEAAATAVKGTVIDTSTHGFRARHDCHELASGQIVTFEHRLAAGRARIMWTRIIGDLVESGFLILPQA